MSITGTHKASVFDPTNTNTHVTDSWTPTPNRYVIAKVENARSGVPGTVVLSGNGLTWELVDSYICDTVDPQFRITTFVAKTGASPSAGAVTATLSISGIGASIIVDELDNVDVSGTALDAVVQSKRGSIDASGTSESITLDSTITPGNATYGCIFLQHANAVTPGTGYSILGDGSHLGPVAHLLTLFKSDGTQTLDASWSTSIGKGGIALEIKAASGGTPVTIVFDTANIVSSSPSFGLIPGSISKTLFTAVLSSIGIPLGVVPGEKNIDINTATIIASGTPFDVVPGTFTLILDTAALAAIGDSLDILPGEKTTQINTAQLNAVGQLIGVGTISPVTINLNTALMYSSGQPIDILTGPVSILLDTSILTISGVSLNVVPGEFVMILDTAVLTINGVDISLHGPLIAVVKSWTLHDRSTDWKLHDRNPDWTLPNIDTDWSIDER